MTATILDPAQIEAREASKARHPSSQGAEAPTLAESPTTDGKSDIWIFGLKATMDGLHVAECLIPSISPHFTTELDIRVFGEVAINFFSVETSLAANPVMHIRGIAKAVPQENGMTTITLGGQYEWVDNNLPNMPEILGIKPSGLHLV